MDFCENIGKHWNESMSVMLLINKNLDNILPFIDDLPNKTLSFLKNFKLSKVQTFRILNFVRMTSVIGYSFKISNIYNIKGNSIVTMKMLQRALKEFHVVYIDRRKDKDYDLLKFYRRKSKFITLPDMDNFSDSSNDENKGNGYN
jgi:hypothetical protein